MKKYDLLMARVMSDLECDKFDSEDKYYNMLDNEVKDKNNDILMSKLKLSNIMFKFEEVEIPSLFKFIKDNIINNDIIKTNDIGSASSSFDSLMEYFEWGTPIYELLDKLSVKLGKYYNYSNIDTRILKINKDEISAELLKLHRMIDLICKEDPEFGLLKETLHGFKLYNPFADIISFITVEDLPEKYKNLDMKKLNDIKNIAYRAQTNNNTSVLKLKSFDEILGDAE
jgi:hypothetical protein